ncbi:putative WIF domain-containing protein [Seiridium cardinale]
MAGCPGFGLAPTAFSYTRYHRINCLARKLAAPPPPARPNVPHADRTLFNVLSWCADLIISASIPGMISATGVLDNGYREAAGFTGMAQLYVVLFLILQANRAAGTFFHGHLKFQSPVDIDVNYGQWVARNQMFRRCVSTFCNIIPVMDWPAALPIWVDTWPEGLIGI